MDDDPDVTDPPGPDDDLDLADYRRAVFELYARARIGRASPEARCRAFRRARDRLFLHHPQSALSPEQKARFRGLAYCPYDPAMRFVVPLEDPGDASVVEVHLREEGLVRMRRAGRVRFAVGGQAVSLTLFWILGYAGGLFLPFRDATGDDETYEGGRYLLDTAKGADLGRADLGRADPGREAGGLVLDFNYAYNPSCAYHPRWDCPLAPPENHLPVAIRAGEKRYPAI